MNGFTRLLMDEQGAALSEYALVTALLALGMIGALNLLGTTVGQGLQNVASSLTAAQQGP